MVLKPPDYIEAFETLIVRNGLGLFSIQFGTGRGPPVPLSFSSWHDLRYTPADGQHSSETRARSTPRQENHLGGGLGANAQNPRQLHTETSQLLAWAQAQGWLIDTDDLFRHIGFIKKVRSGGEHNV